jgi:hypothetical protein
MVSSINNDATTIGDNVGLVAAMIAVVVAQVLKPFSDWTVTGRFKVGMMVGSGGFPSSHSSLVTALATGAAYQSGLGDPAFATALVLALVVRASPRPATGHSRSVASTPLEKHSPARRLSGTETVSRFRRASRVFRFGPRDAEVERRLSSKTPARLTIS